MRDRDKRGPLAWLFFAGVVCLIAVFGFLGDATQHLGAASIPIWFATVGAIAWTLRGPLGQAMAKRIAGDSDPEAVAEVPEAVYAELDDLRVRVGELEERLDFSERLLAQRSQQGEGS
jgi:hypothetical protein